MTHKRTRTSTTRNPRLGKRARLESQSPTRSQRRDPNDENRQRRDPGGANRDSDDEDSDGGSQLPAIRRDMTRDELYEAARRLEAENAKSQRTQQETRRNALVDVTNIEAATEAAAADKAADDDVRFVQAAAKKFVGTLMLWLPAGWEDEVWAAKADENFNPLDRFGREGQPANKIQGALRDLYTVLPEEYHAEDFNGWIPATFHAGMSDQRSFTVTRLRHHPDLWDCTTAELSSPDERRKFRKLVGLRPMRKNPNKFYYDSDNVPLLHADYQEKYDRKKIFLGPLLFIVHAAITLGPVCASKMKANCPMPKVQSVANLWGLKRTTPGMIAAAAIWLRWIFSVDNEFLPTGDTSNIDWQKDFEHYLQLLTEGLAKKKPSILHVFRVWDSKFYPNSDEGMAAGVDSDDEAEQGRQAALEDMNAEESEHDNASDADDDT
ncbi:hypothetical protein DFH06DRAFT_1482251 [Mycena polygramma]|nr:hypothetical protein DFH06DRAFT_1482251 [Mycena polygramma]